MYVFGCLCPFAKNTSGVHYPCGVKCMSLFLISIKYTLNFHVNLKKYGHLSSYHTLKYATMSGPQLITVVNGHQSMSAHQSEQTLAKNNVRLGEPVMP